MWTIVIKVNGADASGEIPETNKTATAQRLVGLSGASTGEGYYFWPYATKPTGGICLRSKQVIEVAAGDLPQAAQVGFSDLFK